MILTTPPSDTYTLLDSGKGEKLEQYGAYVLARPDPQALWEKSESHLIWNKADARFIREGKSALWKKKESLPDKWNISFGGLQFEIRPTSFKHTGLFPEQLPNWDWLQKIITNEKKKGQPVRVLNLFGYTGGATLAAAQAGADVCHVDGSKMALAWARKNQELSGLSEKPIRWILDDALQFVRRENKRGNAYDIIVVDPPAFGHGPKGEVWKIEEQFLELIEQMEKALSDKPLGILVNGYASGYSSIAYANILTTMMQKYKGVIEHGELAIIQKGGKVQLPCGIFARWSSHT